MKIYKENPLEKKYNFHYLPKLYIGSFTNVFHVSFKFRYVYKWKYYAEHIYVSYIFKLSQSKQLLEFNDIFFQSVDTFVHSVNIYYI